MNGEDEVRSLITVHRSLLRTNALAALSAAGIVTLFCLLLLAHDPLVFWNDDYEISILPVFADVARAWSRGEFPLLSPYSWVCGNLAGEFQYGTFSFFVNGLVVLIWKLPLVFSQQAAALSIVHLALLSAGAFLLGRDRGFSPATSTLIALIAALNGWIICWGASDWFGALGAVTWLPWAWWRAERALDSNRSRWRFLWPAPFVYLLVTGGFPYTVLMLLLVLGWLATRELVSTRQLTRIIPLLLGAALGFGMAGPAWLALLEYVRGSAREALQPAAHFQWIVPWKAWPGLLLPSWTVKWADFSSRLMPHPATELACGLVPLAAILSACIFKPRALFKRVRWELLLLVLVSFLAMTPTAGVFRWSFRWLPLFHLVLALCAAEALRLTTERTKNTEDETTMKSSVLSVSSVVRLPALFALMLLILLVLAAKFFGFGGEYLFPLGLILVGLSFLWLVVDCLGPVTVREWTPVAVAFAALLATYFCIPPNCGVPRYKFAQSLLQPAPLDRQRLYISFYPPPEYAYRLEAHPGPVGQVVRPGSTSMWAGLRFVNGYSPIRPAGVAREFASDIHGEIEEHVAEWLAWSEARPDGLLERLGIDGIIVARAFNFAPLPASEWQLVFQNEEARVYHRRGQPIARVRSVNWNGDHAFARVSQVNDSRNYVSAEIEVPAGNQPALLAFSRPYFPGYRALLNGRDLPVTTSRNLIPLVEIPAGTRGTVRLLYRPSWLVAGGIVATFCAVVWIFAVLLAVRSSHCERRVKTRSG